MRAGHTAALLLLLAAGLAAAAESSSTSRPRRELQKVKPPGRGRPQDAHFACLGKAEGYYADSTVHCEAFHYCKPDGTRYSFVCPPKSRFNQKLLICDYDPAAALLCPESARYYAYNTTAGDKSSGDSESGSEEGDSKLSTNSNATLKPLKAKAAATTVPQHSSTHQSSSTTPVPRVRITPQVTTTPSPGDDYEEYEDDDYYDDEDTARGPEGNTSLQTATKASSTTPLPTRPTEGQTNQHRHPATPHTSRPYVPRNHYPMARPIRPPAQETPPVYRERVPGPGLPARHPLRPFLQNPPVFLPFKEAPTGSLGLSVQSHPKQSVPLFRNPNEQFKHRDVAPGSFVEYTAPDHELSSHVTYEHEQQRLPGEIMGFVGKPEHAPQGNDGVHIHPQRYHFGVSENQVEEGGAEGLSIGPWHAPDERDRVLSLPRKAVEAKQHSQDVASYVEYEDVPPKKLLHWGSFPPGRHRWKFDSRDDRPWVRSRLQSPPAGEGYGVQYILGRDTSSQSMFSERQRGQPTPPGESERPLLHVGDFAVRGHQHAWHSGLGTPRKYDATSYEESPSSESGSGTTREDMSSWKPLEPAASENVHTNATLSAGYYKTASGIFEYRPSSSRSKRSARTRARRQLLSRLFGRRPSLSLNEFGSGTFSGIPRPFLFGGNPSSFLAHSPSFPAFPQSMDEVWSPNAFQEPPEPPGRRPFTVPPSMDATIPWQQPMFSDGMRPDGSRIPPPASDTDDDAEDDMAVASTSPDQGASDLRLTTHMGETMATPVPDEPFSVDKHDLSGSVGKPHLGSESNAGLSTVEYDEPDPAPHVEPPPPNFQQRAPFPFLHFPQEGEQGAAQYEGQSEPERPVPEQFHPPQITTNRLVNLKPEPSNPHGMENRPTNPFHNQFQSHLLAQHQFQRSPSSSFTDPRPYYDQQRPRFPPEQLAQIMRDMKLRNRVPVEAPEPPRQELHYAQQSPPEMQSFGQFQTWHMREPARTVFPRLPSVSYQYGRPYGHKEDVASEMSYPLPNGHGHHFVPGFGQGTPQYVEPQRNAAYSWRPHVLQPQLPNEPYFSQQLHEKNPALQKPPKPQKGDLLRPPSTSAPRRRKPGRRRRPKPTKVPPSASPSRLPLQRTTKAPEVQTQRPTSKWVKPYGTRLQGEDDWSHTTPLTFSASPTRATPLPRHSTPALTFNTRTEAQTQQHQRRNHLQNSTSEITLPSRQDTAPYHSVTTTNGSEWPFTSSLTKTTSSQSGTTTAHDVSTTTPAPPPKILMLSSSPLTVTAETSANQKTTLWHWTATTTKPNATTRKPTTPDTLRPADMRIFSGKIGASIISTASMKPSTRPPPPADHDKNSDENVIGNGRDKGFPFEFFTDVNRLTRTTPLPSSPFPQPVYRPPVTEVVTAISFKDSSSSATTTPSVAN